MCKSNLVEKPTDSHLFCAVNIPAPLTTRACAPLVGLNSKNPPKIKIHIIREIDWLYLCMQQFDKFLKKTGNGRHVNLCENLPAWKISWNHNINRVNLFLAGFSYLKPLCAPIHTTAQPHTLLWVRTVRTVRIMVSSVSVRVYAVRFSQLFDVVVHST